MENARIKKKYGKIHKNRRRLVIMDDYESGSYIRVCDIEKYYGNASNVTKAIDRVSFQVEKGEFVGVMGDRKSVV